MNNLKKMLFLIVCVVMVLSGCAENTTKAFKLPKEMKTISDGIVYENDNYVLSWNDDRKCVFFKNKKTDYTWSTTPYEFFMSGESSYGLNSPIYIEYYKPSDNSIMTSKAFECLETETVSAEIKDNALKVTYYFTDPEIGVTVTYSLREDSLNVSMNSNEFIETGKTKLLSVTLAPFMCAIKNSADKSNYLFVPSGSGALMYVDDEITDEFRGFSNEVYGNDIAKAKLDNPGDEEPIRIPVFGATNGEDALLGIIEENEGSASIVAEAGNTIYGYSNVCAKFDVRGYNNIEWQNGASHGVDVANDTVIINQSFPKNRVFSVGYYPLDSEKANYNGMAECYRKYLENKKELKKSSKQQNVYQVTLIGGVTTKDFICGLPYDKFLPLTDFSQAEEICNELFLETKHKPMVVLNGFGETGVDIGEIGGGFSVASKLGGKKALKNFESFCSTNKISLYTDFDIIRFTKSGNGFSLFFDSAKTANEETVVLYPLKKNVHVENTDATAIRFLGRKQIDDAVNKLLKATKNNVSGVSLASFGSLAYSDYQDDAYMVKGNIKEQSADIIGKLNKDGHGVATSAANAYIAGVSDEIYNVPLQNGGYYALDETVPFYEMVYGGKIPLYSTSINLTQNSNEALLRAIEAGVSPSFTVSSIIDNCLMDNTGTQFYGILYENNISLIKDTVDKTATILNKIAGSGIKKHEIIYSGISKTEFNNGTVVYVNYTDEAVDVEGVSVKAKSFAY